MTNKPLLKIEDTFLIHGRGLIVAPALPLPTSGSFRPRQDKVIVYRPDGTEVELEARFQLEHFHLVDGGTQLSIIVIFPNSSQDDVPAGSEVMVSENVFSALRGGPIR